MNVDDLTPDALAKLEAKLLADLEKVRRVRELLEGQRGAASSAARPSGPGGLQRAALPVSMPPATTPRVEDEVTSPAPPAAPPPPPPMPFHEIMLQALQAMPPEGFNLGQLKLAMQKITHTSPRDEGVKSAMHRLIRKGTVVVVKTSIGRIGNTYRYAAPAEASAAAAPPDAANPQADAASPQPPAAN